jgi:hypothetical protein
MQRLAEVCRQINETVTDGLVEWSAALLIEPHRPESVATEADGGSPILWCARCGAPAPCDEYVRLTTERYRYRQERQKRRLT